MPIGIILLVYEFFSQFCYFGAEFIIIIIIFVIIPTFGIRATTAKVSHILISTYYIYLLHFSNKISVLNIQWLNNSSNITQSISIRAGQIPKVILSTIYRESDLQKIQNTSNLLMMFPVVVTLWVGYGYFE